MRPGNVESDARPPRPQCPYFQTGDVAVPPEKRPEMMTPMLRKGRVRPPDRALLFVRRPGVLFGARGPYFRSPHRQS